MNLRFSKYLRTVGRKAALLACLTLALYVAHAPAQNLNAGEIRGTVTDQSGAAIPGAEVTITNTQTGVRVSAKSDSGGVYDVPSLTPGTYTVSVSSKSFKTTVHTNILLRTLPITVNATLLPGAVSQQVTVNANYTQLQTEDPTQSETIDAVTVTGVPNVGANWFNETVLIPGVNGGGGQNTNGSGIGINGTQPYEESFLLNGGTATQIGSQNPDWIVTPTDFIQEIDFDTHTFSAASGNGAAIFNVITKSGTNRFHGSLFEYNQNSALSARNYFSIGVPPLSSNQYGGTIGGPILHQRLFFFFGFQGLGSTSGSTGYFTVPTAAERAGNFTGLPTIYDPSTTTTVNGQTTRTAFPDNMIPAGDINAQAQKIESFFAAPNLPGIVNNLYYSQQVFDTTRWYNGKIDYNINPTNHLNGSVTYGTVNFPSPSPTAPIGEYTENGKEGAYQVSETWSPSSTTVNELRYAFLRFNGVWVGGDYNKNYPSQIGIPNPLSNVFPNISVSGTISTGFSTGLDANFSENTFVPSDVLTLVRGKNILKFGGEFDKYQANINFGGYSDGNFGFTGIATRNPADPTSSGIGYADFLLGDVANWSVAISPETGSRLSSTQLFAEDDYKLRPNLTLNLGLRYQIQPGWSEAHNKLGDFDPTLTNPATGTPGALWFAPNYGRSSVEATQYNLWQPRVGFAWSPGPNWSVRGGFGIYTELFGYNTYAGSPGLGYTAQNSESSTDLVTPVFNLAQGPPSPIYPTNATRTPDLLNGQGVAYIPYHTPVTSVDQWQLDIQRQLPQRILLDIAYVGTRGVNIPLAADENQVPESLIYHAASGADMQQYRPYTQYQGISSTLAEGISHYDSLQLSGRKEYANGLQFIANFTYSHTLDMGTGSGYGGPGALSSLWQNGYNPQSSYGNSLLDVPYTFNGDVIYELPVGQGKRFLNHGGLANALIGGWVSSALWQVHAGIPFTPYVGTANLDGSLAGTWFPNRLASGKVANPSLQEWFDPAAFAIPSVGTFGNSSRNILFGPAWRELDLSLAKRWAIPRLGEASNLQFRIDAFDALNNPNFANPNAAIGTPAVGTITGANTSRQVQLSAKFVF
jgi:hypothetical protein